MVYLLGVASVLCVSFGLFFQDMLRRRASFLRDRIFRHWSKMSDTASYTAVITVCAPPFFVLWCFGSDTDPVQESDQKMRRLLRLKIKLKRKPRKHQRSGPSQREWKKRPSLHRRVRRVRWVQRIQRIKENLLASLLQSKHYW